MWPEYCIAAKTACKGTHFCETDQEKRYFFIPQDTPRHTFVQNFSSHAIFATTDGQNREFALRMAKNGLKIDFRIKKILRKFGQVANNG